MSARTAEMMEHLKNKWDPILIKLTDGSECLVAQGEYPTSSDSYFTIIPGGLIAISSFAVLQTAEEVVDILEINYGSIVDFTILSADQFRLSYSLT